MKIVTLFQSLLIIALLFLTACNSTEHKTIKTGQKATLKETLDTAIDANISSNEAGMIMSVWQDGEVLYTGQNPAIRALDVCSKVHRVPREHRSQTVL